MLRVLALLAVVAAIALPSFGVPIRGDEAWYLVVAREAAAGRPPYTSAWDVTNPGLFAWYAAAGRLFGFDEDGVRLFEWVWTAALAVVVSVAVRRQAGGPFPIAPGAVAAALYYGSGYTDAGHLARAEGLIVLPLFAGAALLAADRDRPRWWLGVAAGVVWGVAVSIKLLYAPLVVASAVGLAGPRRRDWLRQAAGVLVGGGLVAAAVGGYFAANGAAGRAAWTLFAVPPLVLAEGKVGDLSRLVAVIRWLVGTQGGPAAAAVLGLAMRVRRQPDRLLVVWVGVGVLTLPLVFVQRTSWWPYHGMLPAGFVAVGVGLAWSELRAAASKVPASRVLVGLAGVAAAAGLLAPEAGVSALAVRHRLLVAAADREAMRADLGPANQAARREADWLANRPGTVYVMGDPLLYLYADRRPALAVSGWSLELWPRVVRDELTAEFAARPPDWVYVARAGDDFEQLLAARYPAIRRRLDADYRPVREVPNGRWYGRRD